MSGIQLARFDWAQEQIEDRAPKAVVYGNDPRFGVPFSRACLLAAIDYAESLGRGTVVYCPAGIYDVGSGLSFNEKSVQLRGDGAYPTAWSTGSVPTPHNADVQPGGTVFWASSQSGPVLDFTGYRPPWSQQANAVFSGFLVLGSGLEGPANHGIHMAKMTATFRDIAVQNTGGSGLHGSGSVGDAQYMCTFENITLGEPVKCVENDVPWVYFSEPNCCKFSRIGLRGLPKGSQFGVNVGVSGAVVIDSPATYASASSEWTACWFENLWVPDNGTLVSIKGIKHRLVGFQFIDCFKNPPNTTKTYQDTNTSFFRVLGAPGAVQGANAIEGVIPGRDHDFPASSGSPWHSIDYGVWLIQGYNRVSGVKGGGSQQVKIAAGSNGNSVELLGSRNAGLGESVVNQSTGVGAYSTTVIDSDRKVISGFRDVRLEGQVFAPYRTVTSSVTLAENETTLICNGSGITITLPVPTFVATDLARRPYLIKNINASPVTLSPAGSSTIDGASSLTLAQWESAELIKVGTNWVTISLSRR